jgi:hypothetical protein
VKPPAALALVALGALGGAAGCRGISDPPFWTESRLGPWDTGRSPVDVALVDVDGDGRLDLLTADRDDSGLSVLIGHEEGGFSPAPRSPFELGFRPHLLETADVDADGRPDAVLSGHDDSRVAVLLSDGRGAFEHAPGSPFAAFDGAVKPHNHGLAVGDVDGDGSPDIVTVDQDRGRVVVLLGDGKGAFSRAPGSPLPVAGRPAAVVLGDTDGDGVLDLVVPDFADGTLATWLGDGRGGFVAAGPAPAAVEDRPLFVALGDVDRDGALDVAVSHEDDPRITVLTGDGAGGFRSGRAPVDARRPCWEVKLVDVDVDGRLDLVCGTVGATVVTLRGNGAGGFRPVQGSPFVVGRMLLSTAIGDVNRDGLPDLVAADAGHHRVTLLLRDPRAEP